MKANRLLKRKQARPRTVAALKRVQPTHPSHKGYTEFITGSTAALKNAHELADAVRDIVLAAQGLVLVLQYAISSARGAKVDSAKEKTATEITPTTTTTATTPATEEQPTKGQP